MCFYLQENASPVAEAEPAAAVGAEPGPGRAPALHWPCSRTGGEAVLSGTTPIAKHRLHL